MLSFRQKIFLSYIAVFLMFIALIFPFATHTVNDIVSKSMVERADELIEILQNAPNDAGMISSLKNMKHKVFFRVGVYDNTKKVLYDSHAKRKLGPKFSTEHVVEHPEVVQAYERGTGTHEEYSDISEQKMYYLARAFDFNQKIYVLRVAVPYQYVADFTQNFEMGFLGLATAILLLFTFMTWFIINHLTNPIQKIIEGIRPYQEGQVQVLPRIEVHTSNPNDDFGRLAKTLNSLSERIQSHIDIITEERNEKLSILESLMEGIVSVDEKNKIIYANKAALGFLRTDSVSILGKDFEETIFPFCSKMLLSCMTQNVILSDFMTVEREGKSLYFNLIAAPKNAETGAVLVMQDQTFHHRTMEMRKEFIANASHELKTPITIIRGFAEALHDNSDLPPEVMTDITGKIVRNCKRMTNLIKDLLTLSDIEHLSESRFQQCDVLHVIEDCISILSEAYPTAIANMHYDETGSYLLTADAKLLELAFVNIMENAAKYSESPAEIDVTITSDSKFVTVSIADKGIGIPENELEYIFHRFFTVNKAHSQKLGGAGLGLSLVESIIEKHNGKIIVESKLGEGSRFTITLPVNEKKFD